MIIAGRIVFLASTYVFGFKGLFNKAMPQKQPLSATEQQMAKALSTEVTFLPGSYDKRFCRGLPIDGLYTEKQIAYLHKCFHKYRRQIKNYELINFTT